MEANFSSQQPVTMTTAFTSDITMTTTYTSDITMTTNPHDITTSAPDCGNGTPMYVGFLCAGVAIIFYGTNFAPVKKFDTGDGMFFQWVVCIAIFCSGLIVQCIRDSPKFYPLCMLGGFFWETGNICVVPIIKTIGLGLGLCIWGTTNLLSGWATGRFGLFGLKPGPPDNYLLNDFGVALAVCSAVIFSLVKNEVSTAGVDHTVTVDITEESPLLQPNSHQPNQPVYHESNVGTHDIVTFDRDRTSPSINNKDEATTSPTSSQDEEEDVSFFEKLSPASKRIFGLVFSVLSGVLYGQIFTPAIYVQNNYSGSSQNALDYVFATFCGIMGTSTVYFLIYAAFCRNRPRVYPRAILPGFVSGLMWGVATSSWFIANKVLSESVAFPIVTTGPAVVASLLGVLVFHEIKGRRNILILLLGICVTLSGALMAGLSKKSDKHKC